MVALALVAALAPASGRAAPVGPTPVADLEMPPATVVLPFENVEGIALVEARIEGDAGRDTTGPLVLDTGAGYLALSYPLAVGLGVAGPFDDPTSVTFAPHRLARLELGSLQMDQVSPVLTVDARVIQRVADRPVLGLLGEKPLSSRAVLVDYRERRLALIPVDAVAARELVDSLEAPGALTERGTALLAVASRASLAGVLSRGALAVPFRLKGDGKIVVRARVLDPGAGGASPWLTFIVDTGATKCVLFRRVTAPKVPGMASWRQIHGLSAPTLVGDSGASIVLVPRLELETGPIRIARDTIDAALMDGPLEDLLSSVVGEPVNGLLGYSFLKHYRVVVDYPHHVLWLDPLPEGWDHRELEYTHVGLQLERRRGALAVVAVADGSPAAAAGIRPGDLVTAIDGAPTAGMDVLRATRLLEGPEGSDVTLTLTRGTHESTLRLVRRRLL